MTVHGWCPNHESGTTDRIATSGKTARSTQFAEDEVVIGDRDPEAFLLSGLRSASSQVPEMNACLSCRAAPSLLDHCATVKTFLSTDGRLRLPSARRSPRHGVLTAGCIDTGLPAGRRYFGQSDKSLIETAKVQHATWVMLTENRCKKYV